MGKIEQTDGSSKGQKYISDRIYVNISYDDNDRAKSIIGKSSLIWDPNYKCCFVNTIEDYNKIKHLEPAPEIITNDFQIKGSPEREFKQVLEQAGLIIPGLPILDGQKHRVQILGKGPKNRSGVYHGYADGRPSGFFQNYVTGVKSSWTFGGEIEGLVQVTKAEMAQRQYNKEFELKIIQAEIADKASFIWENIDKPEKDIQHPYLNSKEIKIHGAKINENGLVVVPLKDELKKLTSLQFIDENGNKTFLSDGKVWGSSHQIGFIRDKDTIFLAEGFSTGATINEQLGCSGYCAMNSGNLIEIAKMIKKKHPYNKVLIACDNDFHNEYNAGLEKGKEAAKIIGEKAIIAVPNFRPGVKGSDWNDFYKNEGQEVFLKSFENLGVKKKEKELERIKFNFKKKKKSKLNKVSKYVRR